MKKLVFGLAILLMSLSAAMAQTWTFGVMSDADKALCAADANWVLGSDRYCYTTALNNEALMANETELAYAKGLKFKAAAPGDKTEGKAKVRLNYGASRLELNGSKIDLVVPSLKAGQKITVSCVTGKSSEARGLNVTNVTPVSGSFNATSTDKVTNVGMVTADGDVTLTTSAGMYIYSIKVEEAGGDTPAPDKDDKVTNAVSRNSKVNQMYVTTTGGDINYYNTEDLTSVKLEGDKTVVAPKHGSGNDEYNASVKEISFAKKVDQGQSGDVDNQEGFIKITEAKGWLESAYLKWEPFEGASSYNVYVGDKKIDAQLVRQYASYFRADVPGLKEGTYTIKVVPVNADGAEIDGANSASNLVVKSYSREGYAHFDYSDGVGAYNNDGTLKSNAKVLYITANTAKTVSTDVVTGKAAEKITGFQAILDAYQKGSDKTPIAFRFIGLINKADLDGISSSAEGIQIKGKSADSELNLTFEGIGDDATVKGFGFLVRNSKSVEFRNFAIMRCMDDALSLDTDNSNIWIHNMDLFYGESGSGDHRKGDGSVDVKADSKKVTVAYNHFYDTGKSSMCGMKSETGENWITYHHNWFDHSDSRHARIRTMSVHMYNNYFQRCDVYGVGACTGSSVFVENNYFDGTYRPIMISAQGTENKGEGGTLSGETGGMIKSFGNVFANKPSNFSYITWQENDADFDAYEASSRDEQVPAMVKTVSGGNTYNNFDTDASKIYSYVIDNAADVPAIVEGFYGAGRLNKGDIDYEIPEVPYVDPSVSDKQHAAIADLVNVVDNYKTKLVKVFGENNASGDNGGDNNDGDKGGDDDGGDVTPVEGTVLCTFTRGANNVAVASNSAFTLASCNNGVNKGTATIDGTTYSECVKMEGAPMCISFTTAQKMTMILYFGSADTKCTAKIDGDKADKVGASIDTTAKTLTVTLEAGAHTITKQDTGNLFGIKLVPVTE